MKIKKHLVNYAALLAVLLFAASLTTAQKPVQPRQEKLLNGLKLLMWNDAATDKVTVKLRLHSGAAFDTANKEGTMALLADALFPNETVKEFFRDDLGGSLEVTSNFDYIQINAIGNADQILTILETVAAAVTKPPIDKDTTAKIRAARLEKVKELEKNPAYVADLLAAKQLFGNYPYGKAAEGTTESLAKIDFADLLLAKQRFLTADNATVAVSGNIKYDYVFKAVRQLFGGWEKSDRRVPATFAESNAPDEKPLVVESNDKDRVEMREAVRGFARNDKDFFALNILVKILQSRGRKKFSNPPDNFSIRQEPHLLTGLIILGNFYLKSEIKPESDEDQETIRVKLILIEYLLDEKISAEEFEKAKSDVLAEMSQKNLADLWLDVDTFKLVSAKDEMARANTVNLADVQRVGEQLKKQPIVNVDIKSSETEKK